MNQTINPIAFLLRAGFALVLASALLLPQAGFAQRSSRDAAEKAEPAFPLTERAEPSIKANSRIQRQIEAMFDAYNEDELEKVQSVATELLENQKAGDYAHAMANRLLAEVANERDDIAGAIDHLNKAIAANVLPNEQHFLSMVLLAQLLGFEEREEEAVVVMKRFLEESASRDPQYRMVYAQSLYRLERYDEAVKEIIAVLDEAEAPDPNWKKLLLAVYVESDRMPDAIVIAEELLAGDPDDKALIVNLASMYLDTEQINKAVALLEDGKQRGLFVAEEDYERLYRLYYNMEGQEAKTIAVITEGLEKGILKPGHQVYNLLGQVYYFSDQTPQAIEAWGKAVEHAPDGRTALNLARVYYNEERYTEAKAAIAQALSQGLETPGDGYVTLGNIEMYGLQNKSAAAAAYREALKLPGSHQEQAQKGLAAANR